MDKSILPISTAKFDPKWFHDNKDKNYIYCDKKGVYNGFRIESLSPYKIDNVECQKNCPLNPKTCSFIKNYKSYLSSLDFNEINNCLITYAEMYKRRRHLDNLPDICLLVHEKPNNPCSERASLIEWFKANGIVLEEYKPLVDRKIGFSF